MSVYCKGYGLDIGYGGDPIAPHAITVDMPVPYTSVGSTPLNLGGDARDLCWFKDEALDFVFSSHLLEDFDADETKLVMLEWLRVLKVGGRLIIYCPDEKIYAEHCRRTGQPHNDGHRVPDFGLEYLKRVIKGLGNVEIIHEAPLTEVYSFDLVLRKTGKNPITTRPLKLKLRRYKEGAKDVLRPYLGPVKRKLVAMLKKG